MMVEDAVPCRYRVRGTRVSSTPVSIRCRNDVAWAAEHGLEENPEWYPELRQGADWKDIALVLYVHGQPGCPRPCDKDEPKGHYVPYDPDKEEKDSEESKEFEEVPAKGSERHEDSDEDEEQTPKEVARLENLIQTQKDRSQIKKVQVEMDDCARPGIAYHPTIVESPRNFKSSNECRVHCRTWPGAGYFTFYAPLSVCHCSPYGATKEEVADMNNLAGALDCGATWEEINKASSSQRKLQGLWILAHDMCAQPPVFPQSLPPPPPHFGQLRGPKQSRRATCPALKTRPEDSMYEPCVGQAHPSPPSTGCHPMERSLPKGSIYDQPMQYMIVLPESQTSHGRSSSKRSQIRLGQSGGPEGSLGPRGSPSRRRLHSMEEKSALDDGMASQRSGAHSQKSLDRGSARQSEAAERSVQNSDAGSLGRRSSIVEEKRLQQRQWHQQLQKVRQLEESESQLRRQEERSRADQWSARKLQEEQLRSKECQIQEVHQRLRRPARDASLAAEPEAAEVTASMNLVQLTSSIAEPPSAKSDVQLASETQGEVRAYPTGHPRSNDLRSFQAGLVVASFLVQLVVLGLFYSYGILFAALKADTGDAASTLALVGSIRDFVFHLSNAPAGFLVHRIGFVRMQAYGAASLLLGMLADSYAPSSCFLFITRSLVGGVAMAMIFTPALAVLYGQGHISPSFLPVAVGLASSGGGLGIVVVNLGLDLLLDSFSWRGVLRICCGAFGLLLFVSVVALWCSLRHQQKQTRESITNCRELRSHSDVRDFVQPFRDLQFLLLNVALFLYCIGFMVPFTHLVYYAETERGLEISAELTSLLGGTGAVARLCFGLLSASVRLSRLFLVVLLVQGASLVCLPFCKDAAQLRAFSAIYGFSSGGRVVLLSLVLNEIFDPQRVAHLYGLCGIPIAFGSLLGPSCVGKVYDFSGQYEGAFFAAGGIVLMAVPVFGLAVLCRRQIEKPSSVTEDPEKADRLDHVIPSRDEQESPERPADRRAGRQTLHSCRILGVSPDDGPDFIQQQYRRGALKRHPDKGGSHDQFTQLQAARDYMEARQSAHGDDMGEARSLKGDQRGGLGRLKPPAEVSRAQPPAPESVKEMAAISLCASPPLSTSSAGSLPLGARQLDRARTGSTGGGLEDGSRTSLPVQDLMVRQERTINLNPDPPPYPISVACSSLMKAAPSTTRKENEACEMMLDLTGEVPVHIPFSQPGGHRNAVADTPPPPLAPSESASESWDPESEDISDPIEDIRAAASSRPVNHSLRCGAASASQKAESSALPPAPGGKVPALDHDEHPHQHRPSSRASQSLA
ncbi:SLC16A12 [Symbiodinium microadriaticum]|nr:SLC16A12 [Symbiodinium microadriaticum]